MWERLVTWLEGPRCGWCGRRSKYYLDALDSQGAMVHEECAKYEQKIDRMVQEHDEELYRHYIWLLDVEDAKRRRVCQTS